MSARLHYGAVSLRLDDVLGTEVGLSTSRLVDISDNSRMQTAALSWTPLDTVAFEVGFSLFSGDKGSSYAPMGDQERYYFSVTLANGSF